MVSWAPTVTRGGAVVNIYDCRNLARVEHLPWWRAQTQTLYPTRVTHTLYVSQRSATWLDISVKDLKSEEFHMKPFEERSCRRWDSNSRTERRFPGQSFVFHYEYPQLSGVPSRFEQSHVSCKDQYFIGNVSRYRDPFIYSKTRMKVLTWGENDSTKEFWSWSWSRTYGITQVTHVPARSDKVFDLNS